MDAHTSYATDYVRQCVEVLKETGADNVGGRGLPVGKEKSAKRSQLRSNLHLAVAAHVDMTPNYSGPVDTVYLGCWRREIFDRIGFFDEELVRNQDDEFNLRIMRSGGKIWQSAKIKSWYYPRDSLRHLFAQYLQYGYWKVRVIQKHRLPASLRHLIPAGFVFTMLVLPILSFAWPTALRVWSGILGAYIFSNAVLSSVTAAPNGWNLFPLLPCVFAIFHIAYGWGFLRGFVDFVILRRKSRHSYAALSRPSGEQVPR